MGVAKCLSLDRAPFSVALDIGGSHIGAATVNLELERREVRPGTFTCVDVDTQDAQTILKAWADVPRWLWPSQHPWRTTRARRVSITSSWP